METATVEQILLAVRQHKTCSRKQLYHYFTELDIQAVGARQRPQRYPADSPARILSHLGLTNGAEAQEGYRLPANGTLVIKHDLPPARTAKELLAALKPQVRAVESILKEKGIVTIRSLQAERKRARAGK